MVAGWNFDNSYLKLPPELYSKTLPQKASAPEVVIYNKKLAAQLGLSAEADANILAGNETPSGTEPFAQSYAGHQFGGFNILGDGRAVILGEHITPDEKRFDIQFKGSGRTAYSRRGDGLAALAPMLREYIISEAMYSLNIPTTRSLAVVKTGDDVLRDKILQGAVLTRVTQSHIRVGTFEFAAHNGNFEVLKALADHSIARHYPDALGENKYLEFFHAVMNAQAKLIANWLRVGFVHGVMNTDNMLISGETIDYGPCAFIDAYSPYAVFSSIDANGRYAFGNQPNIGKWNLARLAESLLPLFDANLEKAVEIAEEAIAEYDDIFKKQMLTVIAAKLGLIKASDDDLILYHQLLGIMAEHGLDYTNTFRNLYNNTQPALTGWHANWLQRLQKDGRTEKEIIISMNSANPAIIPRNHLVEDALKAAVNNDYSIMHTLLKALEKPYDDVNSESEFTKPAPASFADYKTFCGT